MIKRLLFLSVMMGAVGLPYVLSSSSEWWKSFVARFSSTDDGKKSAPAKAPGSTAPRDRRADVALPSLGKAPPVEGAATNDLAEVLNFDGTPAWVMARWPRVTAGLSELDLQGYRVPLVTGTGVDDLAGSLTYYFDKTQHIKFITFRGTTGNPHKIVGLVMARYRLTQQATDDPSLLLYQLKWNGKPQSELRIRPAHVVRAAQPNARYQVELALMRP